MRSRTLLLLLFIVVLPGTAHAKNWWDYLEALSGPGPFKGMKNIMADVYCAGQVAEHNGQKARSDVFKPPLIGGRPNWFGRSMLPETLSQISKTPCVYIDYAELDAEANNMNDRFPHAVEARFLETGLNYRLMHALEVGTGGGLLTLRTKKAPTDVVVHRPVFTPIRLTMMPLHAIPALQKWSWPGAFQVYFRQSFIVGELDGADFGVPTERFREESEFVRSAGFRVDVTKFFRF